MFKIIRKMKVLCFVCLMAIVAVPAMAQNIITTYAGGGPNNVPALSAALFPILGVAADSFGNLYMMDLTRVYRIDKTGQLTIYAGTGRLGPSGDAGPATSAVLGGGRIALDKSGNLFIMDTSNNRVRRVDAATHIITTVAGSGSPGFSGDGGPATSAQVRLTDDSQGVTLDNSGNLYFVDNSRVRRVDAASQVITTVAGGAYCGPYCYVRGEGGPATSAQLLGPKGVAVDSAGNIFIADGPSAYHSAFTVRRVDAGTGVITTIAGNGGGGFVGDGGPGTSAALSDPVDVAVDAAGNVFIVDRGNFRIRRVDAATDVITTVVGNGIWGFSGDEGPATAAELSVMRALTIDSAGNLFIAD